MLARAGFLPLPFPPVPAVDADADFDALGLLTPDVRFPRPRPDVAGRPCPATAGAADGPSPASSVFSGLAR